MRAPACGLSFPQAGAARRGPKIRLATPGNMLGINQVLKPH
jgi:hypothetical protein